MKSSLLTAAAILACLAINAAAHDSDRNPLHRGGYFTTQPTDGTKNVQDGWPYIRAEYTPAPKADPAMPLHPDTGPTPGADADLVVAVMRYDAAGARTLIKAGANVNCMDCTYGRDTGKTPLMLAAQYGGAEKQQNSMVRLLLRYGANPNARTREGYTALFFAAQAGLRHYNGTVDTVAELLAAGADPRLEARDGTTAIFWYAMISIDSREDIYPHNREEIYRDFLAIAKSFHMRGADLSQRDAKDGMTALHAAAQYCNPHGVLMMQAIGIDAATGDNRLLAPKELIDRRIRDEGESRLCRQTLKALNNKALVDHWKQIAIQVAPLAPAKIQ
jgi:hypothetical protein